MVQRSSGMQSIWVVFLGLLCGLPRSLLCLSPVLPLPALSIWALSSLGHIVLTMDISCRRLAAVMHRAVRL